MTHILQHAEITGAAFQIIKHDHKHQLNSVLSEVTMAEIHKLMLMKNVGISVQINSAKLRAAIGKIRSK